VSWRSVNERLTSRGWRNQGKGVPRRKAMTLRFARAAAFSLQALTDPGLENS